MSAICIIPARGGSRRIPKKNIKEFHGKPIIAYSIETAIKSELVDRIIASTDDREIYDIAEEYGADGYIRPRAYGEDDVGTQAVAKECLDFYRYDGEFACVIYATSPLMKKRDLQWGFQILSTEWKTHYVLPVTTQPLALADAGQWYWGKTWAFCTERPLVERYTRVWPIPNERVCDINTPEDWDDALRMYTKLPELEPA